MWSDSTSSPASATSPAATTTPTTTAVANTLPLESNVLRKVASLAYGKATMDQRMHKNKSVPEKVDLQLYDKFEGISRVDFIYKKKKKHKIREFQV